MPATAAKSGSAGEYISHFTAVRMRITGNGIFRMQMHSLDDVVVTDLKELNLFAATNREPTRIMNFMQQRASFLGKTTAINEYFRINRIILFTKPVFTDYPGNL